MELRGRGRNILVTSFIQLGVTASLPTFCNFGNMGSRGSPRKSIGRRRSSSLSSSSSNGNISGDYSRRRGGSRPRPRSLSVGSSGDGSSIDIPTNRRGQRTRASICHEAGGCLFTQSEGRMIARSLRRKLLVNNGKRLSRIERHLLHAINRNGQREEDGWVSATAFEDALAADGKANRGGSAVTRDEALWLSDKLESRSGKKIACLRIRSLLAADDEESLGIRGHKGRGGGDGDGGDNGWRRRVNISTGAAEEGSNSDTWEHDSGGACSIRRRQDGVARWAVRCGTVGQWLQEVASPMENKLFFEFIKGLEKFEHRNGLDHYRISSAHQRNGRRNNGGNDWTEETTVVHLGPMLKAAIRFYV